MKNYNIDEIRELTIEEARQMALETMEIKDHKCIFVDFGDYTEALNALGMRFEELTEEKQKIVKEELRKQIESY